MCQISVFVNTLSCALTEVAELSVSATDRDNGLGVTACSLLHLQFPSPPVSPSPVSFIFSLLHLQFPSSPISSLLHLQSPTPVSFISNLQSPPSPVSNSSFLHFQFPVSFISSLQLQFPSFPISSLLHLQSPTPVSFISNLQSPPSPVSFISKNQFGLRQGREKIIL